MAILLGTIAGGILGGWSDVSLWLFAFVVAVAVAGYMASRWVPAATSAPSTNLGWNPVTGTWRLIVLARERKAVFLSILGVSWFWLLGSVVLAQIPALVRDLAGGPRVVTLIMVVFTVAIAAGSLLCERLSGRRVEIGLVPVGAAGVSIFGLDTMFAIGGIAGSDAPRTVAGVPRGGRGRSAAVRPGHDGGVHGPVRCATAGQHPVAHPERPARPGDRRQQRAELAVHGRGRRISPLAGWCSMARFPDSSPPWRVINAGVAVFIFHQVPEFTMRFLVWAISHTLYRVRHVDLDTIPDRGAAVLVCNHVSHMDACLLAGAVRRPIRFVMHESIYRLPVLNFIFRTGRTIPILPQGEDPRVYEDAFEAIREGLAAGDLLCIFPEGKLTTDGEVDRFRKGIERIIVETPVPVVPLALRGLWGSFFSPEGKGAFRRGAGRFWSRVEIVAGQPVAAVDVDADDLRERVLALRGSSG